MKRLQKNFSEKDSDVSNALFRATNGHYLGGRVIKNMKFDRWPRFTSKRGSLPEEKVNVHPNSYGVPAVREYHKQGHQMVQTRSKPPGGRR